MAVPVRTHRLPHPGQAGGQRSENRLSLTLENDSRIIVVPGTAANIRGYTVDLLLLDEAAFIPDETWMVAHAMTAVSGGRIVAMSTPYGRRGWFYEAWDSGDPRWKRVKITADDCPRITRTYLEEAQRTMPGWFFQSEFYCEFLDAVTAAFSSEDIERAFDEGVQEWKMWSSE